MDDEVSGLRERAERAERLLVAAQKTVSVLVRSSERHAAGTVGSQGMLRQNALLEEVVARKTAELEAERAELAKAHAQLKARFDQLSRMELELRQAQKLEAVGRLAAGVAHEINTPVQFVSDSLHFIRDALGDLIGGLAAHAEFARAMKEKGLDSEASLARLEAAAGDLSYVVENAPPAVERAIEGLGRVADIVKAMKGFAHPDSQEMAPVDLNQAIQSTLTIARNEYKYVADLELDLGELPLVPCLAGEINQAVLNLVVNAAHAVADVVEGTEQRGVIRVSTRLVGDAVEIAVSDTGTGIPTHIQSDIFDPFFTTKEVGRGTGQGLAIARSVVVEKHRGSLRFETTMGRGTTFYIRVPLVQKPAPRFSLLPITGTMPSLFPR